MEWYLKVVRDNYANFNGRASRQEYWMFVLFNIIFAVVAMVVDGVLGLGFIIYLLYMLAVLIPGIAVFVRRMHDIGKSGWWFFISLIPLIGGIWLLVLLATDGSSEDNNYGTSLKTIQTTNEETA